MNPNWVDTNIKQQFDNNWSGEYIDDKFLQKVTDIAILLGITPDDLMTVMAAESRLDPTSANKFAIGLIQFTNPACRQLGTTREALAEMSALEQLDWVFRYFDNFIGKIHNAVDIYVDKQSGKDFNRPAYKRLMKKLKPGDTLFIKSIDRLGRNYEEILEQWRIITKDKQVSIVVIDMPLLDTRQKDRDLTGILISDIVLQLLSYVAQTEREYNRQRQAEGIAIARAKGVRFGRPPLERPEDFPQLHKAWKNNEISARYAAKQLGIAHRTFLLWANDI